MKQNLVTGQGETFSLPLMYTDANDVPVNLTGHSVSLKVMEPNVGTVINETPATVDAQGNINIVVADEVTALWPVGKTAYVVVHEDPLGNKGWLLNGRLTVVGAASV